jgi:hypothetical protein
LTIASSQASVPRIGWEDFFYSMTPASCAASSSCEAAALAAWNFFDSSTKHLRL